MMHPRQVIALAEVADDLNERRAFYAAREAWLADYFWDSVLTDIESLNLYGGIHSMHQGYHRLLASRFPYGIYYDVDAAIVRVVAVLPMRRHPAWIRRRLAGRH